METDQFGLKVHDIFLIDATRTNVFGLLHLRVSLFISMVGVMRERARNCFLWTLFLLTAAD